MPRSKQHVNQTYLALAALGHAIRPREAGIAESARGRTQETILKCAILPEDAGPPLRNRRWWRPRRRRVDGSRQSSLLFRRLFRRHDAATATENNVRRISGRYLRSFGSDVGDSTAFQSMPGDTPVIQRGTAESTRRMPISGVALSPKRCATIARRRNDGFKNWVPQRMRPGNLGDQFRKDPPPPFLLPHQSFLPFSPFPAPSLSLSLAPPHLRSLSTMWQTSHCRTPSARCQCCAKPCAYRAEMQCVRCPTKKKSGRVNYC